MADKEARHLCHELVRIANGRREVPFGELAGDHIVEQNFESLMGAMKAARTGGLLSFDGEKLLRGMHDNVPIKLTEQGLAADAEPAAPKKRAIFDGEEALKEVAKPDGAWNWCLLGPDPEKLPLAGGGSGSVKQMGEAMGSHANTFGLLRLNFGPEGIEKVKWVYVHANLVDDDEESKFSMVERGIAKAKGPLMERAIETHAKTSVRLEMTSRDNLDMEWVLEKLLKVSGADAKFLTMEKYNQGIEELRIASPEEEKAEQDEEQALRHIQSIRPCAVVSKAASVAPVVDETGEITKPDPGEEVKQRKKMPLFKIGDVVKVKMLNSDEATPLWHDDGVIVGIAGDDAQDGTIGIPQGALKLQYKNDKSVRWVMPWKFHTDVAKSNRPVQPTHTVGDLWKETHGFFSSWHVRYFEIHMGFLSWWETQEAAEEGKKTHGCIPLLGLQMKIDGTIVRITSKGCNGVIYTIDASSEENRRTWVAGFEEHAKFAQAVANHLQAEKGEPES